MKPPLTLLVSASLALFVPGASGDEPVDRPTTLTFFLGGVECSACIYSVNDSIREVESVEEIVEGQDSDYYSRVTFDSSKASAHRIAQAVREAFPLHGAPYQAWLRIRIPDYGKQDNAAKVEALMKRWEKEVEPRVTNRTRGEIDLFFLPLPDADGATPGKEESRRGWRHDGFLRAISSPAPDGLGLELEWVTVE